MTGIGIANPKPFLYVKLAQYFEHLGLIAMNKTESDNVKELRTYTGFYDIYVVLHFCW